MQKEIEEIRAKFENETGAVSYEDFEKYSEWLEFEYKKERSKGVQMAGDLGQAYSKISDLERDLNEHCTKEVKYKVLKNPKAPKWIYTALDMLPTKSCELLCQFKDDGRYEKMDYEHCGEDSANLTEYVERFIYL